MLNSIRSLICHWKFNNSIAFDFEWASVYFVIRRCIVEPIVTMLFEGGGGGQLWGLLELTLCFCVFN